VGGIAGSFYHLLTHEYRVEAAENGSQGDQQRRPSSTSRITRADTYPSQPVRIIRRSMTWHLFWSKMTIIPPSVKAPPEKAMRAKPQPIHSSYG